MTKTKLLKHPIAEQATMNDTPYIFARVKRKVA